MADTLLKYWPMVVAFVGFLVWLIRLEARSVENTKEIRRLWYQRKEDQQAEQSAVPGWHINIRILRDVHREEVEAIDATYGVVPSSPSRIFL